MSELDALRAVINESLDVLQAELRAANYPDFWISKAELHPLDDPANLPSPRLFEARRVVLAAAQMLAAVVQPPADKIIQEGWIHQRSSAMSCAVQFNIAQDLADPSVDPEKGVDSKLLAKKYGLSPDPFNRVLRMLAANHFFREVSEGHFANNRLSQMLLPPSAARQSARFTSDFGLIVAGRMVDNLKIEEPLSAAQLAFNFKTDMFTWMGSNPDPKYLNIFTAAMTGCYNAASYGLMADFPWGSLPKGTTVVDIGGGEGGLVMAIAKLYPDLKVVVQDLPELGDAAHRNWKTNIPDIYATGRLSFTPYNFFTPQSLSGEQYIYTMRCIIHDWPEPECIQILNNLKSAMVPSSRLLIVEHVIYPPIAAKEKAPVKLAEIDNSKPYKEMEAPWPLPAGLQTLELTTDYEMFSNFKSAKERTPDEWDDLLGKAGLKVFKIWPTRTEFSIVEIGLA